jgi:hypothetical protein
MRTLLMIIVSGVAGVVAAGARFVYTFFPGMNIMDVVVFGALAVGLTYLRPKRWWIWVLIGITPAMLCVTWSLDRLGLDNLRNGIGYGHAISSAVIPLAAFLSGLGAVRHLRRKADGLAG